ncbi:MAG: hypothetical protein FWE38_03265 [Firmicutes bacterium]|nr:hypothetical protein [Bacillota bacterium]
MNENEIMKMLETEADNVEVPNVLGEVHTALDQRGSVVQDAVIPFRGGRTIWIRIALAVAALVVLVVGSVIMVNQFAFDSNVYATINVTGGPGFAINVNRDSRVIDVATETQDGLTVLDKVDYSRRDFEGVLSALLVVAVDLGFIDSDGLESGQIAFDIETASESGRTRLRGCVNRSVDAAIRHCRNRQGHGNGNHNNSN